MAADRFVYWSDTVPTKEQVWAVIKGYFGEADYDFRYPRSAISLPGHVSSPFRGIDPSRDAAFDMMHLPGEKRRIEVFFHEAEPGNPNVPACLDVITRNADRFTNDVADGLARVLCEAFDGTLEFA